MKTIKSYLPFYLVLLPVLIVWLFEKAILFSLPIMVSPDNTMIYFYLPFLSVIPPLILLIIWLILREKTSSKPIFSGGQSMIIRDIISGSALSGVSILLFMGSFHLLDYLSLTLPDFTRISLMHHIFFSTIGALVSGISEELYFRGLLFQKLHTLKPAMLIFISSLAFSLWHILSPAYLLHTFLMGILFGIVYHKTKRLLPVIVGHTMANMCAGVIISNGYL
jgi:membrane protease YdiL (CAAX protease family)